MGLSTEGDSRAVRPRGYRGDGRSHRHRSIWIGHGGFAKPVTREPRIGSPRSDLLPARSASVAAFETSAVDPSTKEQDALAGPETPTVAR
jgi:hypothetical protein